MAKITFTIPSVLNAGNGEKKTEIDAKTLKESFEKISEIMGDDFKRRVLESDGSPRSLINIYINGKNAVFSDELIHHYVKVMKFTSYQLLLADLIFLRKNLIGFPGK